jgi:hypothetical protein
VIRIVNNDLLHGPSVTKSLKNRNMSSGQDRREISDESKTGIRKMADLNSRNCMISEKLRLKPG